jgi:glucose-6-phosphate 1-dehydrogenase
MTTLTLTSRGSGLRSGAPSEPCVIVIFGATGDLTRRELVPALYDLHAKGILPKPWSVFGFSRGDWNDVAFRKGTRPEDADDKAWDRFAKHMHFVVGDFGSPPDQAYRALKSRIDEVRKAEGIPDRILFHLAVPQSAFGTIVERLDASGLARTDAPDGWRRVVVEKPFGNDEASALALDRDLRRVFREDQIYRIDHFLGKETVQNMLVFRFANPSFEPIWNRHYVDHVQITVAESIGIGTRAGFYEKTGVVRDMIQNHLLQLLCMAAIEPPNRFDADSLRDETVKVLEAVQPLGAHDAVVAQYGPGTVNGEEVAGYRGERGVAADSATPTYAAMRLHIDNWRWSGVPFYLRTGKRLRAKETEVAIHFKPTPHLMFPVDRNRMHSADLVFRLQPDEGIVQTFAAKQPGPDLVVVPVTMAFRYANTFGVERPPRAYAWLLHDVMRNDQTLFARADWIRRAWQILDPQIARWDAQPASDRLAYPAGSEGPPEAAALLERDGRHWRPI